MLPLNLDKPELKVTGEEIPMLWIIEKFQGDFIGVD